MELAEQHAEDYLKKRGLRVERFSKQELRSGKTPDFRVFRKDRLVAYCEAKHIQEDDWLKKQLANAQLLQPVGGPRPDPIPNMLTAQIHKAAQQLFSANREHEYPNILVFVNSNRICTFHGDLIGVLTGNLYVKGGQVEPIFEQFSKGRIRYEKMRIDVFVWLDIWKMDQQPRHWYWANSKHYVDVSTLLGSDPAAHRKVS